MGIHNFERLFKPRTVAVIGASEREGSVGAAIMRNLINGCFKGAIFPINPNWKSLWGLKSYARISEVAQPIDLAVFALPIHMAPAIASECAQKKVAGMVIISAGGKEIGSQGKQIETAIKNEAQPGGMRLIGPNCIGIVNTASNLNASFTSRMPQAGRLAFISQSGAICSTVLDLAVREHIGFSYFISVGSMLDVDFGDLIDYVGADPNVSSIVMYIENLTHVRKFMSAARAVSQVKPIVALKAGRSIAGAQAAASHTGALTGEDAVYDAAFKRCGIVRLYSFEELFDCAELLAKKPRPVERGLTIVTNAGGPGVMSADKLAEYGFAPVALSADTTDQLDAVLPPYWSHGNPVDILGDASPERYARTIEILADAKEVKGIIVIMVPQALSDPTVVAKSLVDFLASQRTPIFTVWMGGTDMQAGKQIFNRAGIPTYDAPERAVRAFMNLYRHSQGVQLRQEIPPQLSGQLHFDHRRALTDIQMALSRGHRELTEIEAKSVLSAYGIPVNRTLLATNGSQAMDLATRIGYPVAMKICARGIPHKTEARGVRLNIGDEAQILNAYEQIMTAAVDFNPQAEIQGVTLQPMHTLPPFELILGIKKDPDFGPILLFGMGGVMTEVLKDRALALPPLNRLLARRLIEDTKVYKLLRGFRNMPCANLDLLEEIVVRLAQLATDFPQIEELDINPMITTENRIWALDARMMLQPAPPKAPSHLVISPYPNQYEGDVTTSGGIDLLIRPILPEDAPLLIDLFNSLSPTSVYYRFFSPLRVLPHHMLARFTQIDYDREIALVAISDSGTQEAMRGVARVILEPNLKTAEFSVLVDDRWHRKGIGAELLKRCLLISRKWGIQKIAGIVLSENTGMLALGRKLGFRLKRISGAREYELILDLDMLKHFDLPVADQNLMQNGGTRPTQSPNRHPTNLRKSAPAQVPAALTDWSDSKSHS